MSAEEHDARAEARARLMQEVAAQMDAIEADFGDEFAIGAVVTVVEVVSGAGTGVRLRCNTMPWIGMGMLHAAMRILESSSDV